MRTAFKKVTSKIGPNSAANWSLREMGRQGEAVNVAVTLSLTSDGGIKRILKEL